MRKTIALIFGLAIITCYGQRNSNEPLENFDAICNLFESNYASFKEKKIDWQTRCSQFRERVSSNTTDPELFHIVAQMLKPLNDAHVTLKARKLDSSFSAGRETRIMNEISSIPRGKRKEGIKRMTELTLTQNGFGPLVEIGPKFRGEKLFAYTKSETVGYLRFFRSFSTYVIMKGPSLDNQLNRIFDSFEDLDAIILDIRFNIGGDDRFSQKIAGRFVDKEMVGFYKQTRSDGKLGELQAKMVKPHGKKPFLNNTVLLTNGKTVSAADVLSLMIDQLPNATLIGEPSNGSYSDLYGRKLPNGCKVTLSNQRYFSPNKNNYEGIGTPVDILVENTLKDIEENKDSVLLTALEFLRQNQKTP